MKRECFNKLLPVKDYYKGWNFRQGETQFNFHPSEDYHKDPYEVKINVDDDVERVEKIETLNQDIDEYTDWVNEQNQFHSDELFEKAKPDGKVHDVEDLNLKKKRYFTLAKHQPWLCSFVIENPQFRKIDNSVEFGYCDDEDIYKLMQEMEEKEFAKRFNATLFDYVRQSVGWLEKNHVWGEDSLWYDPNREFASWFSSRNLRPIIPDVEPVPDSFEAVEPFKTGFFKTGGLPTSTNLAYGILPQVEPQTTEVITNAELNEEMKKIFKIRDWNEPLHLIEEDMRIIYLEKDYQYLFYDEAHSRTTLMQCYRWGCKFWTQNGNPINPTQMQNASTRYTKDDDDMDVSKEAKR
jgi:hypothetical protein